MLVCRYHHRHGASWHCGECGVDFCSTCIPGGESNFMPGQPHCPLCRSSLEYRGRGHEPEPFWRRGGDFLRYALQPPLLLLALVTGWLQTLPGLFAGLLALWFYALVTCYGLLIVVALSRDDWRPPQLNEALSQGGLLAKLILLIVVLFSVPFMLIGVMPVAGILFLVLATVAYPAIIMLLASSGSFGTAVNPLGWIRLMLILGLRYVLLWLALLAVGSAPQWMIVLFPGAHDLAIFAFLVNVVSVLATLVTYALMGYVLHERAGEVGLLEEMDRGRDLEPQEFQRRRALGLSHVYSQEGRHGDARGALEQALETLPGERTLHRQLHRILRVSGKDQALVRHADDYMRLLVEQGYGGSAGEVLRETRSRVPDYLPADAGLCHRLAEALASAGNWRDAARLLVNLHRRAPDYPELGQAYVLLARIFLEGLDRAGDARRLIGFVRRRAPRSLETEPGQQVVRLLDQVATAETPAG